MSKTLFLLPQIIVCNLGLVWMTTTRTAAQVTTDNSINTQVNQDGNVTEITGGETRGNNLFHSFEDFSIPTNREAFFDNANDISNIFSRVTGGNISNINGTIRTNDASLFIVNPAGILFGEGARLDLGGGSFYGSTADSILFESGEFSATNLDSPPLLTVNAPIGFSIRDEPAPITNRSTQGNVGLEVAPGATIGLIGGEINLEGGLITAPGGLVELGGLAGLGTVNFTDDSSLSFANEVGKSNISLTDNAVVDVSSDSGGLITVNANDLQLSGASLFLAGIGEDLGSRDAVAGTIQIDSTSFTATEQSQIRADNSGTGRGGTIDIITDTLDFRDGATIVVSTFGTGDAGTVNLTARDVSFSQEFTGIYSTVGLKAIETEPKIVDVTGNAGVINVNTDTLSLTQGARILTSTAGMGDAGTVNIDATGEVSFVGQGTTVIEDFSSPVLSGANSQARSQSFGGDAGEVNLTAGSFELLDIAGIIVNNASTGNVGKINLNVKGDILIDTGGLILAQATNSSSAGEGGEINFTAGNILTAGSSLILANTRGAGDAGSISFDIDRVITIADNTQIISTLETDAVGNGGEISIEGGEFNLTGNSKILANTSSTDNAGNITLDIAGDINFDNNSQIQSETTGDGEGGEISIEGGEFNLTGNTRVFANTISTGNAGKITLDIAGDINFDNNSRIQSETTGDGNAGEISIKGGKLNLINNSEIIADTTGNGDAGSIELNIAGDISLDNSSQIQSQNRGLKEAEGNAGDITITTAGSLISTNGNLILTDSQARGDSGNITITVAEQIVLSGVSDDGLTSQIVASLSRDTSEGSGGTINIMAGELILDEVAFISSNTVTGSTGRAGEITINVDSLRLQNNSYINAFTGNDSAGGEITVNARTLDLSSGGKIIAAATDGTGNAGNINLNISEQIIIDSAVPSSATNINPEDDLSVSDRLLNDLQSEPSGIYVNTTENATGRGGNISIDSQSLELSNDGVISASSNSSSGGSIDLTIAENLTLRGGSLISAEAANNGDGGNVEISSQFIVAFPDGSNDILASTEGGTGGNIDINAESLFGIQERQPSDLTNDIDASSEFSLDGNVNINVLNFDPIQGVVELPANIVQSENTVAQTCGAESSFANANTFSIQGKGGVPATPEAPLSSYNISIGNNSVSPVPQAIETGAGKIQPARGIEVKEDGSIALIAHRTDNSGSRIPESQTNCST